MKPRHRRRRAIVRPVSLGRQLVTLLAATLVLMRFGLGVGQALAVDTLPAAERDNLLRAALEICTSGGIRTLPTKPADGDAEPAADFGTPFCPACPHFAGIGLFILPEPPVFGPIRDPGRTERHVPPVLLPPQTRDAPFHPRAPPVVL